MLISRELSHSSISNLYLRCRMDFASNAIGTEAPHFVDLRLLAVNASDEIKILVTPTTLSEGQHMDTIYLRRIIFWQSYSGWNEHNRVRTRL